MHTIEKREIILVIIPFTQFRSRVRRKLHFRESNFTNFPGGACPPDPPRSSCLRHSTFAPAARTVHVRQLNHCIRYFQMVPKTLAVCKMVSQTSWYRYSYTVDFVYLTLTSKSIRFSLFGWSGSYQKSKGNVKVTKPETKACERYSRGMLTRDASVRHGSDADFFVSRT